MYPPYSPLENHEWNASWQQSASVHPEMRQLLPGLLQAEALARRSDFARRSGLMTFDDTVAARAQAAASRTLIPATELENRLYTLFAE